MKEEKRLENKASLCKEKDGIFWVFYPLRTRTATCYGYGYGVESGTGEIDTLAKKKKSDDMYISWPWVVRMTLPVLTRPRLFGGVFLFGKNVGRFGRFGKITR